MPNYGDPKYWEDRYKQQTGVTFDWLENYESLKPLFENLLAKDNRVLNVGCGNAELTEDMYDDGYLNIVNTDISEVVIHQMKSRNVGRPGMAWIVDNCLDMDFDDEHFDVVLDKSRH